jgi:regulator of chromosome condensation
MKDNIGQICAGADFTLALTHNRHRLYSFGRADKGQLGIGVIREIEAYRATPQLVQFPEQVKIVEIQAGDMHALARTDQGEVYTWGYGDVGANGHRGAIDTFRPRKLDLGNKKDKLAGESFCRVCGISGGAQHSLALVQYFQGKNRFP